MVRYILYITLISVFVFLSCSENNQKLDDKIAKLDSTFTGYNFDSFMGVYLNVQNTKQEIDTIEVKNIYDYVISEKDSSGEYIKKEDVSWVYLNFYDKEGNFIFQLYRDYSNSNKFVITQIEFY